MCSFTSHQTTKNRAIAHLLFQHCCMIEREAHILQYASIISCMPPELTVTSIIPGSIPRIFVGPVENCTNWTHSYDTGNRKTVCYQLHYICMFLFTQHFLPQTCLCPQLVTRMDFPSFPLQFQKTRVEVFKIKLLSWIRETLSVKIMVTSTLNIKRWQLRPARKINCLWIQGSLLR